MFSRFELEGFAKTAAEAYLSGGHPLNTTISQMARDHQFTTHHVDRVAQNANTLVNASLVKKARDEGSDPRVRFDLASGDEIRKVMKGPPDTSKKVAAVVAAFTMPKREIDRGQMLDTVFGARVPDPFSKHARSVDHGELAETYLLQVKVASAVAPRVTSASIGAALQTLETLHSQARGQATVDKLAMEAAEADLRDQLHDTLLEGATPATLRETVKRAGLDKRVATFIDGLVTKVASDLGLREGKSAFDARCTTNVSHPLFQKAASVLSVIDRASNSGRGLARITSAVDAAKSDFRAAATEGR